MRKTHFLVAFLLLGQSFVWADEDSIYVGNAGNAGRWPILGDYDDKPSSVRAMQYLLKDHGLNVVVDGRFGEQTEKQVWKFQLRNRIDTTVDFAIVNAKTWEYLISDLKRGDKGWAVSALQSLLKFNGHKVVVDGKFGLQTERAVTNFQRQRGILHGVIPPGVVEHFTWCELVGGQCYKGGAG